MRISTSYFTNNFLRQTNQLQGQEIQLQNQATTGLKVSLPEDNPATMNQVLNLQTQDASNTQFQSNITQLQDTATTSGTAMNSLQTAVEQASETAALANGATSTLQLGNYASLIGGYIQQALAAGNTQDAQGNYIFGGTMNGQPPFVATTDADGNVTGVTYQGNTSVSESPIGPGQAVSAQVPGANTTGTGPAGLFADSRTGADVFRDLISLQQNLTAASNGDTSAQTAIATTNMPNLTTDEDNVVSAIAGNGVMQATLESASNTATQLGANIAASTSNLTSADLATTLTKLDQTQTAYQAAMQSGVMILNLSILNFLQ